MELVLLCAVIVLGLLQWSVHRDAAKQAEQLAMLQARYDNLERSGVSLFAKHNELRDRLDKLDPPATTEVADVLGHTEEERRAVINRAALHLLEGKP
jgi:hypothetical protein